MEETKRIPAEWEPYDSVMIAWPHADTDWASNMEEVTECYENLAAAIVASDLNLLIVTPEPNEVKKHIAKLPQERVRLVEVPTNDTWTRDYGPLAMEYAGRVWALDFQFNGWGLKFASNKDNMVNLRMVEQGLLTSNYKPMLHFAFEGGSMEVDGEGTMLTTSECLLSLNRNGVVTKEALCKFFEQAMGIHTMHFLDHGYLRGDDTDSHIDTLARFVSKDTIVYVKCYNPGDEHASELNLMEDELRALRTSEGNPYNLIALPLPDAIYDEDGERLPATYANFLITPKTVLMPVYGQTDNDRLAMQMLRIAFPEREIVAVDCRALIKQHGSLHCATMQLKSELLRK